MIKRIRNVRRKQEKTNQFLLENLIVLLIKKGIISKKDYEEFKKGK